MLRLLLMVVSVTWLCAIAQGNMLNRYKGDVCHREGDTVWTCKHPEQCPQADAAVKTGKQPKICRFEGLDPIVCCDPKGKFEPKANENRVCHQDGDNVWTCKHLSQCPALTNANVMTGNTTDTCGSEGKNEKDPIVCCQPERQFKSKADEKCNEYAKAVYITMEDPILDNEYYYIDTCPIIEPLIQQGTDTQPKEYPHMARIGYGPKGDISWKCDGSLVSERFVLSSAKCSSNNIGPAKWARLGDYNIESTFDQDNGFARPADFEIEQIMFHPGYTEDSYYFDIALFKLDKDVQFNEFIRPICLLYKHDFTETHAIHTGWWKTYLAGENKMDVLQEVNLTVISRDNCNDAHKAIIKGPEQHLQKGIQQRTQLCAKDQTNDKNNCQGSIGGPLQLKLEKPYCMFGLVGVTSFGAGCGDSPAVFTRASYFVPWIEAIIWS